jgi:hypothetical protein
MAYFRPVEGRRPPSPHYGKDVDGDIEVLRSGGSFLLPSEQEVLDNLNTWCGRAIHLQCSHGNDALSLLNEGAVAMVGVDISEKLLAAAQRKSAALNVMSSPER